MTNMGIVLPPENAVLSDSRRPLQELGRKGLETRRRLMTATQELLQTMSAVSLTAAAIARQAKTSSATFYVYFDDVSDVVLALAAEASDDVDAVMATLETWRDGQATEEGARAFFNIYRAYWDEHRAILGIRNMEADRGDPRFLRIRGNVGLRIIRELGALIREGHPHDSLTEEQAVARATVIFAAIERIAATASLYPRDERSTSESALNEAQIAILVSLVRN
jgi:AcrR family transcriptional regulator